MSTPPVGARERLLAAAEELVIEHGFNGTTVDAVLAGASASKGAFFHHFPTKAHLGRALVERYAARDGETLEQAMQAAEAATTDPAAQLVHFTRRFELGADELLAVQPSCLFVSFIYETDLGDVGTEELVTEAILHWRRRILTKLEEAAVGRPSMAGVDLPSLADHWFTTFEGAFLLAKATADPTAMRKQLGHLRLLLELLFAADDPGA